MNLTFLNASVPSSSLFKKVVYELGPVVDKILLEITSRFCSLSAEFKCEHT